MNDNSLRHAMAVMVLAALFGIVALLQSDRPFGMAPFSWGGRLIAAIVLLGIPVGIRIIPYGSPRLKFVLLVSLTILVLELHQVHSAPGSFTLSALIVLTICSIARDAAMLLGIGLFINVLLTCNLLLTDLLKRFPSVAVYNMVIFQVGLALLYIKTRWSNCQIEAISRKIHEAELTASSQSEFLANMSHEIRTPMNAVLGFTTFLQRQELPEESREYVGGIRTAAHTLLTLVNDVLDLSKIESGKYEIVPVTYELASLINDTISTTYGRLENKPIRLLVDVSPDIPACLVGDDVRIRQILTNFLVNAIKYTSQGFVKLKVRGIPSNDRILLCVSVQDSGSGIREEDKVHLFQMFRKFDSRQHRMIEGTGLGLPLSRKLLEAMGGAVFIESVYGEGSTFSFMIPQEIADQSESFVSVKIDRDIRVVVCESNRDEMEIWRKTLTELKIDHLIVGNLSEFVFLLHSNPRPRFFLDSDLYKRFGTGLNPTQGALTIIADRNETFGATMTLPVFRRPVYSLTLAAALGGIELDCQRGGHLADYEQFFAPTVRILVVDDNSVNQTVFEGLLRPYQCDVEMADSGREALELLQLNAFDLVFMDHMMPELDGVETTRLIRGLAGGRLLRRLDGSKQEYVHVDDSYYADLPVIVATANAIAGMREEYLSGDFDDYITKPISPAALHTVLQRWIPQDKQKNIPPPERQPERGRSRTVDKESLMAMKLLFLNTEIGLRFTADRFEGYLKVLKAFQNRAPTSRQYVEDWFKERRWKDLTIEVHAIKSLSTGIGAERLSALAAALEDACRREDEGYIRTHIREFLKTFQLVQRDVGSVLETFRYDPVRAGETSEDQRFDPGTFRILLVAVADALDQFDFSEAMRHFEQIPATWFGAEDTDYFEEVRDMIGRFEYEQAGKKIKDYLQKTIRTDDP